MTTQEARNHHFVPQFLLRSWCIDDLLHGYWWDTRQDRLECKKSGPKSFCRHRDLLRLRTRNVQRDAIETNIFQDIDTRGAEARNRLMESGPSGLSGDERCDFARLLLSLEARRPVNVRKIREGRQFLADNLDNDPGMRAVMADEGLAETPSEYYERETGIFFEDEALTIIQSLVDNPKVGGKLINAHWHIVQLGRFDGSLVLSDRPLIQIRGADHPRFVWALPLSPKAAFIACNHRDELRKIKRWTPQRFAKRINVESAGQADRFIFCADERLKDWIGKRLRSRST